MTRRSIDEGPEERGRYSDGFLGTPDEVDPVEAEELLRAGGVDPEQLKANLYQRAGDLREHYQRSGRKSPKLLEQMLRDLKPDSRVDISASKLLMPERIAIARLVEEIRRLPSLLNRGLQPAFSAAYRNRRELSPRDKDILDCVMNDLLKPTAERDSDVDRSEPRMLQKSRVNSTELRGPAYARALRAELAQDLSNVHEIASELGLSIVEKEAEGFDGALVRATDDPIGAIVVRASIREAGRKNFTIAHEIGHFVLPGQHRSSLACTSSDVANWADASSDHISEREADAFAAELLMPATLVLDTIGSSTPCLEVMEQIARKAQASLSASAWRYCDLTGEKCAVVWSTDGAIQWAKRSASFPFFLPGGWKVRQGTFAAACFAEEKVPGRPRRVPIEFWTDAASLDKSFPLLEQSKALPTYRSVISLLWVEEDGPPSEEARPNPSGIRPLVE